VFFYSRTEADRDWDLDVDSATGPRVHFPAGRAFHVSGRRSLFFHWNPGLTRELIDGEFDAVVVPGWSMPSSLATIWACKRRRVPYVIFSETNDLSPRPWWLRMLKRVLLRPIVGGAAAWLATGSMSKRSRRPSRESVRTVSAHGLTSGSLPMSRLRSSWGA
jgi:hypothetical protein